jgi:16S rRNA (guanine(966)-N(2))-methyltransferase RsmD
MDKAVLIDQDRKAVETIRDNIERAGFADRAEIYRNDAGKALSVMAKRGLVFDLVFLDPPYKLTNMDLVMFQLQEKQMLADGAIIVVEHDAKITYEPQIGDLIRSRCSEYGDTAVSIYRHQARVNTQTLE